MLYETNEIVFLEKKHNLLQFKISLTPTILKRYGIQLLVQQISKSKFNHEHKKNHIKNDIQQTVQCLLLFFFFF